MNILLVAPRRAGDEALEVTAWIAERTADRLGAIATTTTLGGFDVTREGIEAALATVAGVALFTHGSPHHLAACDPEQPALDARNAAAFAGCWVHGFACESGVELAQRCCEEGVGCYAGYTTRLRPEIDPLTLPDELVRVLVPFVTETTFALAQGERDGGEIQRRLFDLRAPLLEWCDSREGTWRIALFAQQLVENLTVWTLARLQTEDITSS